MRAQKTGYAWGLVAWIAVVSAGPGWAQQTAGQAAAAGGGSSTSANGGTGGVGLGGMGPGVAVRPGAAGGAGSPDLGRPPGNGALVGPRAQRQSQELMAEQPQGSASAPRNTGQRALLLDQSRRPATASPAPTGR
ncbi:hypothetical protein [Pseudorhodoferax sp.]|uniref:hypothetical protein n=1 Tax=Pseudorhodoferax sp. TaxID=1993553 RepID=UPI002DD67FD5|nr:hypothetical protein [Pseudorhodoferax sp.]